MEKNIKTTKHVAEIMKHFTGNETKDQICCRIDEYLNKYIITPEEKEKICMDVFALYFFKMKKIQLCNVIKIKDGVVDEVVISTTDAEEAEREFFRCAKELGADEEDDFLLDEGYYEIANASVCITWSDVKIK